MDLSNQDEQKDKYNSQRKTQSSRQMEKLTGLNKSPVN